MKNPGAFPTGVEQWAVLRTSARWEKKIATSLLEANVPAYVPMMTRVVQYASKRSVADIPIFSGYVFCSEPDFLGNQRVAQACRKQIAQILRTADFAKLREELESVAEIASKHELIQESVYGSPGDRVRIISGPLCGTPGVVLALKPRKRIIVLEISFLGARLEAEVEEHQVRKEQ